jgi:hypothetical protein
MGMARVTMFWDGSIFEFRVVMMLGPLVLMGGVKKMGVALDYLFRPPKNCVNLIIKYCFY